MQRYLILAGASGTGKTFFRELLVNNFPKLFTTVTQYTTRPKRPKESNNNYKFVDEAKFNEVSDSLIGKCTINGNHYGSIPLASDEERIGIIILNEEGLNDFLQWIKSNEVYVDYRSIGIYRPLDEVANIRKDERSVEYIAGEYKIYGLVDVVFNNDYEAVPLQKVCSLFYNIGQSMIMRETADEYESEFKKFCIDAETIINKNKVILQKS